MGERTGVINFINSHDYTSDITGDEMNGCLAGLTHEAGQTMLYTRSTRLHNTLEMAYASKVLVTVNFWDKPADAFTNAENDLDMRGILASSSTEGDSLDGPFDVKAIWTRV